MNKKLWSAFVMALALLIAPVGSYGKSPKKPKKESNTENPRGLYKMTKLIGKQGEIDAPFDQYKYCTDSIALTIWMGNGYLRIANNDGKVLNYTGELPKENFDTSTLVFDSNSKHFSEKWWSEYIDHKYFPDNDWCTEIYESGQYSKQAKPFIEALLASGRLDTLTVTNFPIGSSFVFEKTIIQAKNSKSSSKARSRMSKENPRGLYKMTKLIGKQGEIDAPFDQYKYCTDSITLTIWMENDYLRIANNDGKVFNYTGEYPKKENDTSTLVFDSNSKHFSMKWWSTYNDPYLPYNDWCTEVYESDSYSKEAKPYLEALLASGILDTLTQTNFPYQSRFSYNDTPLCSLRTTNIVKDELESETENPRGLYKLKKTMKESGAISFPRDEYIYCTDSITVELFWGGDALFLRNYRSVLRYTGKKTDTNNASDYSNYVSNSNAKHFRLENNTYLEGWETRLYESGICSERAKPHLEKLLASGVLNKLNEINFNGVYCRVDEVDSILFSQRRIALIIGNAEYQYTRRLNSPVIDASTLGQALKELRFDDVRVVRNATAKEMKDAIDQFTTDARQYGAALFYYSGHGIQEEHENYLLPIDFKGEKKSELLDCGRPKHIMEDLDEAGCKQKIIILDACRDNPFSMAKGVTAGGLAPMEGSAGTCIVYATAENKTAEDGRPGKNSLFTKSFLDAIKSGYSSSIYSVFERVGKYVMEDSRGRQSPKIYYQPPMNDFQFNRGFSYKDGHFIRYNY